MARQRIEETDYEAATERIPIEEIQAARARAEQAVARQKRTEPVLPGRTLPDPPLQPAEFETSEPAPFHVPREDSLGPAKRGTAQVDPHTGVSYKLGLSRAQVEERMATGLSPVPMLRLWPLTMRR